MKGVGKLGDPSQSATALVLARRVPRSEALPPAGDIQVTAAALGTEAVVIGAALRGGENPKEQTEVSCNEPRQTADYGTKTASDRGS